MFIPCLRSEIYKNHVLLFYIENDLLAIEIAEVLFALLVIRRGKAKGLWFLRL